MQRLIISGIVSGILVFLLTTILIYYVDKQPIKKSIKIGLISGIGFPVFMGLIMGLFYFLGI